MYKAYLVELFPFAQRAKGITIFQLFGRSAGFFTTFVNPIGLNDIGWKWMITYCAWLGVEIAFIVSGQRLYSRPSVANSLKQYFMFPETYGRTLEELAFLFEDRALADEATMKVEKQMEWSAEQRWSRVEDRMSWDMDVIMPNKFDVRSDEEGARRAREARNNSIAAAREADPAQSNYKQAIRGERGGWSGS
jgi:hypothetical protein